MIASGSDCSHTKTKVEVTNSCGSLQLCVGLQFGIEANLHAIRAIWPQSAGGTQDGVSEEENDGYPWVTMTLRSVHTEGLQDPGVDGFSC